MWWVGFFFKYSLHILWVSYSKPAPNLQTTVDELVDYDLSSTEIYM